MNGEILQIHEWHSFQLHTFCYHFVSSLHTTSKQLVSMTNPSPIRIKPDVHQRAMENKPQYYNMTSWVNHLIDKGLQAHLGLDLDGRLGKPTDKEENKEGKKEVLPNNIEPNRINKVKKKNRKYDPVETSSKLNECKDLVFKFWEVKAGAKTKEAWSLLNRELVKIKEKYGSLSVKDQLEKAIVGGRKGPWASITLSNYEAMGRPTRNEPLENLMKHPAHRVMKNGRWEDES